VCEKSIAKTEKKRGKRKGIVSQMYFAPAVSGRTRGGNFLERKNIQQRNQRGKGGQDNYVKEEKKKRTYHV